MNITIGILTYNQDKFVIQTLESVKYQIQTFGQDNYYTLIIADDGSADFTVRNIKIWVENNKDLFNKIIFLDNEKNQGTVLNFIGLLKNVEDNYFKIIAGDDLLSFNNLKNYFDKLDKCDIVSSCTTGIKGNKVCNYANIYTYFANKKHEYLIKKIKKENIFIAPETVFSYKMITEELLEFLRQFDLIEDHPMFVKMLEQRNVIIDFTDLSCVLYRISHNSVSRSKKTRNRYIKDKIKLESYLIKNEKNVFRISQHKVKCQLLKIENKKKSPIFYIAKIKYLYRSCVAKCLKKNEIECINKNLDLYQKYYDDIVEKSNEFIRQNIELQG